MNNSINNLRLSRANDELFLGIGFRHELSETFTLAGEWVTTSPANTLSGGETTPRLGFQWEFYENSFLDFMATQGVGSMSSFRGIYTAYRLEF